MDLVLRAGFTYLFLLVVFRIMGSRTLSELSTFDLALLLIISESAQNAMVGDDHSVTGSVVVIITLAMLNVGLSIAKLRWSVVARCVDGVPTILIADGRPLTESLRRARVSIEEVLEAARKLRGLERLDQIKYAVLEGSGGITIIPQPEARLNGAVEHAAGAYRD